MSAPNILTQNYCDRLARANTALRELRAQGCKVVRMQVQAGDAIVRPVVLYQGGGAGVSISDRGVDIVREFSPIQGKPFLMAGPGGEAVETLDGVQPLAPRLLEAAGFQ